MDVPAADAESVPVPPDLREVVTTVFGDALTAATEYAELLADAGVVRGLIGPREVPRLWERHLLNSAALAAAVPQGAEVADVGSGAGLPGIPLALARPDLRVTLIEPLLRRSTFLAEAIDHLGLQDRVTVLRARAEELHGKRHFDVVTARAVAPLDRLVGWTVPLLDKGGRLLALKGEAAEEELARAHVALAASGASWARIRDLDHHGIRLTVIEVEAGRRGTAIAPQGRSVRPSKRSGRRPT